MLCNRRDDNNGATVMFIAIKYSHVDVVKVLYEYEYDVNEGNDSGVTPVIVVNILLQRWDM